MRPTNRLLFIAAVVVGPVGALAGMGLVAPWVCLAVVAAAAVVAMADCWRARRTLSALTVTLPAMTQAIRGHRLTLAATMHNRNPQALDIQLALELPAGLTSPEATVQGVVPPGVSELAVPVDPAARGHQALAAAHVEAGSPWGLWSVMTTLPVSAEVRVYPDLRDQPASLLMLRRKAGGNRVVRVVGKGREFEKLREYAPGDSFDEICWKATARRSRPVVKQFQTEHSQEVYAVVDASRLTARGDTLERYVNAALHLLITAEQQGDRIGLITFSDQVHKLVKAANGRGHFRACREAIFALTPRRVAPDFRELFTSIQLNLHKRSLLVVLTALDDPALAEGFLNDVPLIARRHLVSVNMLRGAGVGPLFTEGTSADPYEALGGQLVWNKLKAVERSLELAGIRFAMIEPAEIATRLSAIYLDVKRRQLL